MSAWQRKGGERHDHSPRRASPAPPSGGTHRLVPDPLATRDTDQASNLRAQPPPFRQPGEKSGLGIADQVVGKSKMIPAEPVGAVVARGEAEIGLQQASELLPVPGIDYVGP